MFVKGKVICSSLSSFFMINISWHRDPERIRGDLWRCQSNYLVTCVRRHLQVGATFSFTNRSTVGSRSTVAQSVTSLLFKMSIWKSTPSFTAGRNHTSAHSATFHVTQLTASNCMSRGTPGKNCIIAINVNIKQQQQSIWKGTRRRTLVKSHTGAHHAIIRAFKLVIWNFMWWGCTQERSRSNVTSATMLALNLLLCKATWGRTLGRCHSSATNAAKPTNIRKILESMSRFIFDLIISATNATEMRYLGKHVKVHI